MSGVEASRVFSQHLWEYEKSEVIDFDQIFFFNVQERIKQSNTQ